MSRLRVAIGEGLKDCPGVITLGVRSQIGDYTEQERKMLRAADTVFYPTARFVDLFATLKKKTFPSINCYRLRGNRLKQVALMHMLEVDYPRTRVYYGEKQKQRILDDFAFPLIAKRPFRSSPGREVFFIDDMDKLGWYKQNFNPAYIQGHVPAEMELRVVVVNYTETFGYWRRVTSNVSRRKPGSNRVWQTDKVPVEAIVLAKKIARQGDLSDVAVEIISVGSRFYVLELNFEYEEMGDLHPGLDRLKIIMDMIEQGVL